MVIRKLRATVAPAIALGLTGSTVTVVLPGILAEAVRSGRAASAILSAEMLGATLSTALLSPFLDRTNRRVAAILAVCIALLGDVLSTQLVSTELLAAVRLAAGVAEGAVLALAVAYVAVSKLPERNIGFFVASNLLTSTVIIRLLPSIAAILGGHGGFAALALLSTVSLVSAVALPPDRDRRKSSSLDHGKSGAIGRSGDVSRLAIGAGLVGNIVLFTGAGSVWPSIGAFAALIKIPLGTVTHVLSDATLAGLAGALAASWVGAVCARRAPLTAGTLLMLMSFVMLGTARGTAGLAAAAMLFMMSWIFVVPFYVGILAAADPQGRAAAFSMATQYGGMALGASLAGILGAHDRALPVLTAGAALVIAALLMMWLANVLVARRQKDFYRGTEGCSERTG
jgi:predicted MFS family arabinose efflux permease